MLPALARTLAPVLLATLAGLPPQQAPAAKPPAKPAGQEQPKPAAPAKPAPEAAAQDGRPADFSPDKALAARYARAMATDEHHAWLAGLEGKWKTSSRYTVRAGAPAVESTGSSEFKMLMDGRFLVENHDAAGSAGPFRGMGITGYNTVTGKFERVWADTSSTAMLVSQGEFDAQAGQVKWVDTWSDPATSARRELTSVLKKVDEKQFTFQQMDSTNGTEFKRLVVLYKRAD